MFCGRCGSASLGAKEFSRVSRREEVSRRGGAPAGGAFIRCFALMEKVVSAIGLKSPDPRHGIFARRSICGNAALCNARMDGNRSALGFIAAP